MVRFDVDLTAETEAFAPIVTLVILYVGRLDLLVRMYHNRLCTYRIKLPRFQECNTVSI